MKFLTLFLNNVTSKLSLVSVIYFLFAFMLYVLKIKGTETIPDFVQIRDEDMTLRAYFRLSQLDSGLKKNKLEEDTKGIIDLLNKMPYGIIHKYYRKNE